MTMEPLKRNTPDPEADAPPSKRSRSTPPPASAAFEPDFIDISMLKIDEPTPLMQSKAGLQRAIALALRHVGFSGARPDAMESFTNVVEEYMQSFIEETKRLSYNARRAEPTPADVEFTLRHFNLSTLSLKPHVHHPIPQDDLIIDFFDPFDFSYGDSDGHLPTPLPTLSDELSSRAEKEAKPYIPPSFPDFPSVHTYKYTPKADREARDPTRIREEAAKSAKQGEDALRGFLVAAKSQQQKKVRSSAERDRKRKERHGLWEAAMQQLVGSKEKGRGPLSQLEIADHSMIVNAEAAYQRREVSRAGKKSQGVGEGMGKT